MVAKVIIPEIFFPHITDMQFPGTWSANYFTADKNGAIGQGPYKTDIGVRGTIRATMHIVDSKGTVTDE